MLLGQEAVTRSPWRRPVDADVLQPGLSIRTDSNLPFHELLSGSYTATVLLLVSFF